MNYEKITIHRIFFLLFLAFTINIAIAQDNQALLQQAADAYSAGNYQNAIALYEQVLASGEHAFEVYYNLGNAYFKEGEIAPAILNYERAARLNPADPDLQHNLAMAQARTVDKVDMLPVPELITGFKSFVNGIPADTWAIFSIVAFILMLILIGVFLFSAPRWIKQLTFSLAVVALIFALVFLFFGWQQQRWINSQKEAIIFEPSITVVSTPDQSAQNLFVLHEGTKVRVIERFRDWIRIRIGDGNTGWVPGETVKEI